MDGIRIGVIGGSGIGQLLGGQEGRRHEVQTPFGRPSDAIVETNWEGLPVLLLGRHGAGHPLNPSAIPVRANIFALKLLGCTHILAAGAVGSLRQEFAPRDLVLPDQIIDRTRRRETSFYDGAAVHVEFAEPFCPVLRRVLLEAAKEHAGKFTLHDGGCYLCMEGPAFSTRAESLMHRIIGGDLIGMTICPEAKLAREAEIPYASVALVTDYDCWKSKAVEPGKEPPPAKDSAATEPESLLGEIIGNLNAAVESAMGLMRSAIRRIAADPAALAACPAREALKLAIWSDKKSIKPEEIRRLAPLWGRYFE